MSEIDELKKRIIKLENRVTKLEENSEHIESGIKNNLDNIGLKLQGKIDSIGQQKLIIIALRFKPQQSKSNLLDVLMNWGMKKTIHKWFRGGNFNNRLLNNGIIRKDGTNSDNEDLFSLTISKGIPKADELIQKYELS